MDNHKFTVLLVDDNAAVLDSLAGLFSDDYDVRTARSGSESLDVARHEPELAAVVMDIKMVEMDGLTAARHLRRIRPLTPIIFHTGYPGEYDERRIDAEEMPYDYIQKGRSILRLQRSLRNAVESYRLKTDLKSLSRSAETDFGMIGRSQTMLDVFRKIRQVAPTHNKVMILGESGTGKELVARAIHYYSPRQNGRLGILNCNHKDPGIVESELFGHVRGAFTGAVEGRTGLFEYACGGTVFLDEIGDLDMRTQAKLLRVLETGEFKKLGAPDYMTTDVRLLCATHQNLPAMVQQHRFRQDLYFRLRGVVITLPALRSRKEDILPMVERFSARFSIEHGLPPKIFDDSAKERLLDYDWPGNVRQLVDTIESLIVLTDSEIIFGDDVSRFLESESRGNNRDSRGLTERMRHQERTWILEALLRTNRNISAAARWLKIDRSTLQKKIKSHRINLTLLEDSSSPARHSAPAG